MTLDKGEIDYPNGHIFEFGLKKYDEEKTEFNYKPEVYNFPVDGNASKVVDDEIDIIIKDILTKKKMGYKVLDKDNGFRECKYSDFSIIIDRRGEFSRYRRKFAEHNIPLKVIDKEDFFTSDVIYVVKNLIKMLYYSQIGEYENEYHHAFFSVARSFLYQYSDGKLFKIAIERSYLNEPFAQKIELLKERLRFKSLKQILKALYEEFDIYQKISRITNYYANVHKLERLISIADSFDSLRYSRDDFVKFFDDLANINLDIEYKENNSSIDAVTLINIHQSKGLEYPIIYFPGLSKNFNRSDMFNEFAFTDSYGMTLTNPDSKYPSLVSHFIKEELIKADFEEKLRLLYVAFTRAREKIIILNPYKEKEKMIFNPIYCLNFKDVLSLTDYLSKYSSDYSFDYDEVSDASNKKEISPIKLKEINVPAKEIIKIRASKEKSIDVSDDVLDFGSELHAYLENIDIESKDTNYVKNRQMRRYVYNVLNSPLFNGVTNEMIRHEYHFYDSDSGVDGYIDCLVIKENEIDIIDFKLKNIDEVEYDRQLRIYKEYIKKITDKPIKMYLLAAITGEIKEVKDE